MENVCKPGDSYFRSGDLLQQDRWGFLYFCDRLGETFRWKGENVSTSEVARTILTCSSYFLEVVVYGVVIEGQPGRAGMATAVLRQSARQNTNADDKGNDDVNTWQKSLWHSLQDELPQYAQPLFLRITNEIEKTSTQKYKKKKLQDESFFNCGTDQVYFRDDFAKSYVLMEDTIKDEILSGKRRV